ncbi:MAG: 3-deoxy-manno-octulosonate cytidylyltransferase [Elusimicrobiaceae bacterium]|nr:3-deoxy-manno-octulosonate cytidylyltransferase [Elusimicrobiaceae bacterium]
MSDILIIIPARYGSTRLPAKMLADLGGKPVIARTYQACAGAGIGEVLVATDHEDIVKAVAQCGGRSVMTPADCQSGTDRVWLAAKNRAEQIIINVQGDEPLISPETIRKTAAVLRDWRDADISTAAAPFPPDRNPDDPNAVKAVLAAPLENRDGKRALYFTRSAAPYRHELSPLRERVPYFLHCGIYGYRRASLERFVKLPPSALEQLERLEQLRALEAGMVIRCAMVASVPPAIDTGSDLAAAQRHLEIH